MASEKVEILIPCELNLQPQNNAIDQTSAALKKAVAQFEGLSNLSLDSPDLLFMRSLLVSVGSNKNDDVFLPEEMWNARHTPILKPIDWEHETGRELTPTEQQQNPKKVVVDNQTIGVMYNAYAIDENGEVIDESTASSPDFQVPRNFHIVDEGVIWKALYPSVAKRIEEGASNGTLFVSMEAWFPDYCYLVGNKVVARNSETAFLDKSLRAKGGNGVYQGATVKRVLRGLTFGGKGIVMKPANEPSVIMDISHSPLKAAASLDKAIAENILFDIAEAKGTHTEESDMATEKTVSLELYEKAQAENVNLRAEAMKKVAEMDEMKKKAEMKKEEAGKVKAELDATRSAFAKGMKLLDEVIPGFSAKVEAGEIEDFFGVLAESVAELKDAKASVEQSLEEARAEALRVAEEARAAAREAKIDALLGLSSGAEMPEALKKKMEEKKEKMKAAVQDLSDEAFASLYEVWAEQKAEADELVKKAESMEHGDKMAKDKKAEDEKKEEAGYKNKADEEAAASAGDPELNQGALAQILAYAKKQGGEFNTVEDLLATVASTHEASDEENLAAALDGVEASERTVAGTDSNQLGVQLENSMASIVGLILDTDEENK